MAVTPFLLPPPGDDYPRDDVRQTERNAEESGEKEDGEERWLCHSSKTHEDCASNEGEDHRERPPVPLRQRLSRVRPALVRWALGSALSRALTLFAMAIAAPGAASPSPTLLFTRHLLRPPPIATAMRLIS